MVQPRHCLAFIDIALRDKLHPTIAAVPVSVPPALRMLVVAAFLDDKVRIYHFATLNAAPDWRVRAPVVQIWTSF